MRHAQAEVPPGQSGDPCWLTIRAPPIGSWESMLWHVSAIAAGRQIPAPSGAGGAARWDAPTSLAQNMPRYVRLVLQPDFVTWRSGGQFIGGADR